MLGICSRPPPEGGDPARALCPPSASVSGHSGASSSDTGWATPGGERAASRPARNSSKSKSERGGCCWSAKALVVRLGDLARLPSRCIEWDPEEDAGADCSPEMPVKAGQSQRGRVEEGNADARFHARARRTAAQAAIHALQAWTVAAGQCGCLRDVSGRKAHPLAALASASRLLVVQQCLLPADDERVSHPSTGSIRAEEGASLPCAPWRKTDTGC